jgi:hypothetical protein
MVILVVFENGPDRCGVRLSDGSVEQRPLVPSVQLRLHYFTNECPFGPSKISSSRGLANGNAVVYETGVNFVLAGATRLHVLRAFAPNRCRTIAMLGFFEAISAAVFASLLITTVHIQTLPSRCTQRLV